ncbi:hypothetical protein RKD37_000932 [Streptomyces ambofaciens]
MAKEVDPDDDHGLGGAASVGAAVRQDPQHGVQPAGRARRVGEQCLELVGHQHQSGPPAVAGQRLLHGRTDALLVGELPGQRRPAVVPVGLHGVRVSRRGQSPGEQFLGGEAQAQRDAGDHVTVVVEAPEQAGTDQRGLADPGGPEHWQEGHLLLVEEFDQPLCLVPTAVEDGAVVLGEGQQFPVRAVRQQPPAQLGPFPGEGLHGERVAGPAALVPLDGDDDADDTAVLLVPHRRSAEAACQRERYVLVAGQLPPAGALAALDDAARPDSGVLGATSSRVLREPEGPPAVPGQIVRLHDPQGDGTRRGLVGQLQDGDVTAAVGGHRHAEMYGRRDLGAPGQQGEVQGDREEFGQWLVLRKVSRGGDHVSAREQQPVGDQERHPDRTAPVQHPGRSALPCAGRFGCRCHVPPSVRLHSSSSLMWASPDPFATTRPASAVTRSPNSART